MSSLWRLTKGFSGSSAKGFETLSEAQQWLEEVPLNGLALMHTTTRNISWNISTGADGHTFIGEASTSMSTTVSMGVSSAIPHQYPGPSSTSAWTEYESPLNGQNQPGSSGAQLSSQSALQPGAAQGPPPPPQPPRPVINLSAEQRFVLDKVLSGKNIFFTGPAGSTLRFFFLRWIYIQLNHSQVLVNLSFCAK
ncbi:hypothetical protein BV22DRAFT_131930 [Leucogyrophana mollusca]|uniref:Uncharacterized protein n=1 Tax=Leucogyrophana mollusca TaxID=85980 RepID=A0ACB8BUG9_9AGAM|nr:hypothetical protein BV22DRAFT_131930 [Leucogyrophana mollusca]